MYFQIEFEWQRRAVLNDLICNLVNDIGVFWFCHKRKGNLIPGPEKKQNQNLEKNGSPANSTWSHSERKEGPKDEFLAQQKILQTNHQPLTWLISL